MKKNNKTLTNIFYGVSALLLAGLAVGAITALDYTNNPIIKDSETTETCNCNDYHIAEDAIIYDFTTYRECVPYDSESYQAAVAAGHNSNSFIDFSKEAFSIIYFTGFIDDNPEENILLNNDITYSVSLICSFDVNGFTEDESSYLNIGFYYDFMGEEQSTLAGGSLYKSDFNFINNDCEYSEFNFVKLPLCEFSADRSTFQLDVCEFSGDYFYIDSLVFEPIGSSVQSMCYTSSNNEDSVEEVVDDEEENSSEEITYIEESPAIDSVLDWTILR